MASSDWQNVEISELHSDTAELYRIAKEQYRTYKAAREKFEQAMQDNYADALGDDEELKFGYNFGKLSIAVGEKRERKPKRDTAGKPSLGDWLKARQDSGYGN